MAVQNKSPISWSMPSPSSGSVPWRFKIHLGSSISPHASWWSLPSLFTAMKRVQTVSKHLVPQVAAAEAKPTVTSFSEGLSQEEQMTLLQTMMKYRIQRQKFLKDGTFPDMSGFDLMLATRFEMGVRLPIPQLVNMIQQGQADGSLAVLNTLPGPWAHCSTLEEKATVVNEILMADKQGYNIFKYADWQLQYGDGLGSNIVIPFYMSYLNPPKLLPRVILSDPEDAERISRIHVRKEGNFRAGLYDSLIATDDNEHWKKQRHALSDVFLPLSSLARILPVSLSRAKQCTRRLASLVEGGAAIDMSDFLLHEAQAQLQLALLGAPEELMEATNEDLRAVFLGDLKRGQVGALGSAMKALMKHAQEEPSLAAPGDGRPIKGPLSRGVQASDLTPADDYGNMLLILFAGHDTTGHTMTWLLLELARHPDIQQRLQVDISDFFRDLQGRDPTYQDLASPRLDFLDRCITETLRLWPAVPNGTFRQLQFADTVKGLDGKEVLLPKGTPVNIVNWPRHRNEALWGPDANEFNPARDFAAKEVARVGCPMAATNPQSARFSPFAHNPRSCLGKNFAQMEMRLIMVYLLHGFDFALASPYTRLHGQQNPVVPNTDDFRGVNRATMGPMDLEHAHECSWGIRHTYGLKMHAKPRAANA